MQIPQKRDKLLHGSILHIVICIVNGIVILLLYALLRIGNVRFEMLSELITEELGQVVSIGIQESETKAGLFLCKFI